MQSLFHKHLFEKLFMTTYITVVTASKQTCGNFEVRCPHLFEILLQCRLQVSIKCRLCELRLYPILCLFQDVLQAHLLRLRFYRLFPLNQRGRYGAYTEHIRAYTGLFLHIRSIYGPFFAYTEHIRAFFSIYGAYTGLFFPCIYGAYTGHFFAYTEHAYTEHIRGIFFCIYGAYTCIYGTCFQILDIYWAYTNIYGLLKNLVRYILGD